jgi:Tol biopolymer transport system component
MINLIRNVAVLQACACGSLLAQTSAPLRPAFHELAPVGAEVSGITESPDGHLILLVTLAAGGATEWHIFERATGRLRVVSNPGIEAVWSPRADEVAFARAVDRSAWFHIWTQAVEPHTGLPLGLPRRVSMRPGRGPAYSPDGRTIAYTALPPSGLTTAPRIILVPAAGGEERVLVHAPGFAQDLSWSPDGRSIFYRYHPGQGGAIVHLNRVRIADGSVETLNRAGWPVKGNADGRLLAYSPLAADPTLALLTTEGVEVGTFAMPLGLRAFGWSSRGLKLLAALNSFPSTLGTVPLPAGPSRLVSASESDYVPSWSPDARQIALITRVGARRHLAVQNATGTTRRHLPTRTEPDLRPPLWSPDQRYLAFTAQSPSRLSIIDVQTGVETVLVQATGFEGARWRADGRALLIAVGSEERTELREVVPGGRSTLLRRLDGPLHSYRIAFINDTTVVIGDDTTLQVASLRSGGVRTLVGPGDPAHASWRGQGIAISSDGEFIVLPVTASAANRFSFHILSTNGAARREVPVKGLVPLGPHFRWHPDGRHVMGLARSDRGAALYLFPLNGDAPWPLLPDEFSERIDFDIAPDGTAVAYASYRAASSILYEIDLSGAVPRLQRPNGR